MTDLSFPAALFLAAVGLILLYRAYGSRNEDVPARARLAVAGLIFFSVLSAGAVLMNGVDPVNLYQSSITFPSAAVFLFALAGTFALWPSRPVRRASFPVAFLGLIGVVTGSTLFLERFGRDLFLGDADPVTWQTIAAQPTHQSPIPFYATGVRLSPGGKSVLVTSAGDANDHEPGFFVGRSGGALVRIDANEAVFLDDDRLLAADLHDEDAEVREIHVDDPAHALWRRRIDGIGAPVLSYRASTRTWQLLGVDNRGGVVRATAVLGGDEVDTTRWAPSPDPTRWPQVIAASGNQALVVETTTPSFGDARVSLLWSLLQGFRMESRVSRVDAAGRTELARTRFTAQCLTAFVPADSLMCSAFDGSRTRFAALDAATSTVTSMTWVAGRFAGIAISEDGWMSGWLGTEPVAVRPSTREGLRLPRSRYQVSQVVAHGGTLAALSFSERGSMLLLYRLQAGQLRAGGR
jgi:hypothetical protein